MKNNVKLFIGNDYYPLGGYKDFKGYFDNIDLAKKYVEEEYAHESCMWHKSL